ncbi:hypothetical protein RM545_01135 [Zunongwangia sp. F260]|uniref:Uncharacterized protein n=1 Tax=Autumnicola lenta TaxID=3075593 RepID=A0ABU3CG07_9FLAO|nr:hypothetical protein [Zunongwangia sp. F260]MDT0645278.1 hypothetical protein [Zunongwangia sp. F260]
MSRRNLVLISKIIFFYSVFYIIMKIIAIFGGAWILPNLVLTIPYAIFVAIGAYMVKTEKYSWAYVIAGVIVISIVRYYESEWLLELQQYFS